MSPHLAPGAIWIHGPSGDEHMVLPARIVGDKPYALCEDGKLCTVSPPLPASRFRGDWEATDKLFEQMEEKGDGPSMSSWYGTPGEFEAEFIPAVH